MSDTAPGGKPDNQRDWIESIVRVAAALGANPVRVRWKLLALQKRMAVARGTAETRVEHARWAHNVCTSCGAIADRSERNCPQCGARLGPRWLAALGRLGLVPAVPGLATMLLSVLILAGFGRELVACGLGSLLAPSGACLVGLGANLRAVDGLPAPELWRLGTSVFLHIGIIHLGFNLAALAQVGPMVEDVFGRGRTLFLFMATGLAASFVSMRFGGYGSAAGASGALMGLTGVAAGWGQRDGTTVGYTVRNHMLRWALYTMLFGYFIGADNWAHGGGFACGAVLGFAARPTWLRARGPSLREAILGASGALAAFVFVVLLFVNQPLPEPDLDSYEDDPAPETTEHPR